MTCSRHLIRFTFILCLVTHTAPSFSAQRSVEAEIQALLEQQNTAEAYALAKRYQSEFEGDVGFDYTFGLAAKSHGDLNQAIFAFERVLQVQPSAIDARLMLAASYFDLGNFDAAEKELSLLQRFDIENSALSDTIQTYLKAIEKRRSQLNKRLRSSFRAGLGSDSNPNNGVADEFINIPVIGPVTLFAESLENSSVYADFYGQVVYLKPINQHSSWQFSGSVLHAEYEDNLALNRTFATASFGYQTRYSEIDFSGSVFYRPLWLDGDSLLDYYGAMATASKRINNSLTVGIDLSLSQEDYAEFRGFDRDQTLVNAWLELPQSTGKHKVALKYGQEQASDNRDFLDRDLMGLGYQWQQKIDQRWEYSFSIDYLDSEYQGVNPLFEVVREDSFFSSDLELRYSMAERLALMSRLSYLKNDSDIPIYEYQRVKIWIGASYEF